MFADVSPAAKEIAHDDAMVLPLLIDIFVDAEHIGPRRAARVSCAAM